MKIVPPKPKKTKPMTIRISSDTIDRVTEAAKKHRVSRQQLIDKILQQAMNDPKFTVRFD